MSELFSDTENETTKTEEIEENAIKPCSQQNLIRLEEAGKIYLNVEHPLSIGLINNQQLRINFQEIINRFNAVLNIFTTKSSLEEQPDVVIEFRNQADSLELKKALEEFRVKQFLYKIVALPDVIDIEKSVQSFLKKYVAVYFRQVGNELHFYGPVKALDRILTKIKSFIDNLVKTKGVWKVSRFYFNKF